MGYFIGELRSRNETLFWFGLACFVLAFVFLALTRYSTVQIAGVNAWFKPFKFAASIAIYSFTMAWYAFYLGPSFNIKAYNTVVVVLFGFEVVYIALQAYRGQLSHFNVSTPLYSFLYSAMAIAASVVTLYTAYIGILFFQSHFPALAPHYLWAIRISIVLFVVFSFEGFVMGSRMAHTIGGPDGGNGIPLLNWSTKFGDPRIAHFIGMHALQVIPLASYYLLKNTKATLLLGLLYGLLALAILLQALKGKPLVKL